VAGIKWHNIEGTEPLSSTTNTTTVAPAVEEKAPVYPTSSKTGAKNWDALAASYTKKPSEKKATSDGEEGEEEDMKVDSDDEASDAVDGFFKKLYKDADPDTRRAMMKSFLESNGTALSTNWSEVGKGKVEEVQSRED
jgi:suppressor of G2 allele of SKP1